jgi:hypothetical protein
LGDQSPVSSVLGLSTQGEGVLAHLRVLARWNGGVKCRKRRKSPQDGNRTDERADEHADIILRFMREPPYEVYGGHPFDFRLLRVDDVDTMDPEALSLLAFIISALIVGTGSVAVWVWRRGWHVGRVSRE